MRRARADTLYVTPDGKHALTGEIMPFGANPYEPAKEALLRGFNGPSRGREGACDDCRVQ